MKRGVFGVKQVNIKKENKLKMVIMFLLTVALSLCQSNVYIQCHETFESLAKYISTIVYTHSHFRL